MHTWNLTLADVPAAGALAELNIAGTANTRSAAVAGLVDATRDAIARGDVAVLERLDLVLDGALAARLAVPATAGPLDPAAARAALLEVLDRAAAGLAGDADSVALS